MITLADSAARRRALTDLNSTLLVEAAAGTGKTALIAGRVTMALLAGTEPRHMAAITFTELAASELSARIDKFVAELLAGRVPECLQPVLPSGLDAAQQITLVTAANSIDELTVTTIHGFCQSIIHSHAVEADIDPGARMMDAPQSDAAFDAIFDQWLRRRLSVSMGLGDPIAALSNEDPRRVVATLRSFAWFRREHRTAKPVSADLSARLDIEFGEAVTAFGRWMAQAPAEAKTASVLADLETLSGFYAGALDPRPDFPRLWKLAHPPIVACMRRDSFDIIAPQRKNAWQKLAGKDIGARLSSEADALFARANTSYRMLLGRIATALVETLSVELDEVLNDYAVFKRAAAVLDFDDLLHRARALVRGHEQVRRALGERYHHILVDEFQDTDPIQAEILFRIAADDAPSQWQQSKLRGGALFMVGDPKQAIYRFRGADVGSYEQARRAIARQWPDNVVQITANFRSVPGILDYINGHFGATLDGKGQPGYVALTPVRADASHGLPCVAKRTIELPSDCKAHEIRDAEAEEIADLCVRLIGNLKVHDEAGNLVPLDPGGIALLTPTGTQLWRYERALEARGLPIASRAGKSLFRRQEVHDLIAVARTLADSSDTLAFGAVMRGPLVGLTEEELLDVADQLPPRSDEPDSIPVFSLRTEPSDVAHPVAREVLTILRDLRRRSYTTTPALLLAEAVERLSVRPLLATREGNRRSRAAANVERFLELAKGYGVAGLKRFVHDITNEWASPNAERVEGRVDSEGAIELVTMHSSKGLEWPVVILINTGTGLMSRNPFVHRADDDTLHWVLGDVEPPDLALALAEDARVSASERQRLWYVACSRAKELLVIPKVPAMSYSTWANVVPNAHDGVPELATSTFRAVVRQAVADPQNPQTAEVFESERVAIRRATCKIAWLKPSDQDPDRVQEVESVVVDVDASPEAPTPVGGGRIRGLVLHKLIEEVLTGEVAQDTLGLVQRADFLMSQLSAGRSVRTDLPVAAELAQTVLRTLALPEIDSMRANLVPELPIFDLRSSDAEPLALAGRVDALVLEQGQVSVVVDWKSDIEPSAHDVQLHASQMRDYLLATAAPRGVLVYMTSGTVRWIELAGR